MVVDPDALRTPPSSFTSHPPLSSVGRRPPLSQDQLTALNEAMNDLSHSGGWQSRIADAGDDASKLRSLFSNILFYLCSVLLAIAPKANIIATPLPKQANELVRNLNNDGLEEWQRGVQRGLSEGDWAVLTAHRTCYTGSGGVTQIINCSLAMLRKPPPVRRLARWDDTRHAPFSCNSARMLTRCTCSQIARRSTIPPACI